MVTLTGALLQLVPLVISFVISSLFLNTLRQGKTPLITAIATLEFGETLPTEMALYTRRLTAVWGAFLILLGIKHLAVQWPQELWTATLLTDPILIGFFFLLEFNWRRVLFPARSFASPWALFRLIRQHGGLFCLYRRCMT